MLKSDFPADIHYRKFVDEQVITARFLQVRKTVDLEQDDAIAGMKVERDAVLGELLQLSGRLQRFGALNQTAQHVLSDRVRAVSLFVLQLVHLVDDLVNRSVQHARQQPGRN
ncbi:hypothetical protein D3C78_1152260 [compost metagenome]